MKGIWTWPSEPKEQDKTLRKVMQEDELVTILLALAKSTHGLSNSQLDRLLENNSQWRTLSHMRELDGVAVRPVPRSVLRRRWKI